MAQSNACPSSFAAADGAVIEGSALPYLTAPLLRRGSSRAVGSGGRSGVPPLRHFLSLSKAARPGGRALRPSTSRHLLGKARRGYGTAPAVIFLLDSPQVGRRKSRLPLRLCAPEALQNLASTRLPLWGTGCKPTWRTEFAPAASPAILWFLSHRWERNSPRRAKPCVTARRVVAPYSREHRESGWLGQAPPCHKSALGGRFMGTDSEISLCNPT